MDPHSQRGRRGQPSITRGAQLHLDTHQAGARRDATPHPLRGHTLRRLSGGDPVVAETQTLHRRHDLGGEGAARAGHKTAAAQWKLSQGSVEHSSGFQKCVMFRPCDSCERSQRRRRVAVCYRSRPTPRGQRQINQAGG